MFFKIYYITHFAQDLKRQLDKIFSWLLKILVHDIALPITYEPVRKDVLFYDVLTKKDRKQSSVTKNEIFRAILAQALQNQVNLRKVS